MSDRPDRNRSAGPDSPVLLTCNFQLTVERVKRVLEGMDAYLLVANSRGVNVWCAATGGLLTDHDVISVLKTSGIEDRVDHRQVVLPQLAATGIEGKVVQHRTGWRVVWGPVQRRGYSRLSGQRDARTRSMRTVTFPWPQRLEMAVAWAFPISQLALSCCRCGGRDPTAWAWCGRCRWRSSSAFRSTKGSFSRRQIASASSFSTSVRAASS